MTSKLERWAWVGGAVLAGIAGMVNAVGYLSYAHQAVTHLTGTTTLLSVASAGGDLSAVLHLALVVLSFLLGAIVSGVLLRGNTLKLGRAYGVALLLESILLVVAALLLGAHNVLGSYLASAACGLQNAMASTYGGAVLRTTHVTGMITDIGITLGQGLRGRAMDLGRLRLYSLLFLAFTVGGVLAALLFPHLDYGTLFVPALLTGGIALAYSVYSHFHPNPAVSKDRSIP